MLKPKDHAEAVAMFRYGLIARLCSRELCRGELADELRGIAQERVRLPESPRTRTFSVATLERWLYAYRARGLEGLRPRSRKDQGRGRDLEPILRQLLCDIRREHPSASVPLILRTLRADGRIHADLSASTVRRLFRQEGLDKVSQRDGKGPTTRLRWQAERPNALWHADVCHGPTLTFGERRTPVRIHALLDDASRYVVALSVESDEKEETMLRLLVRALRLHGLPEALYLDNGSTYRGEALQLCCARLGVSLLHAKPYDAEARGKMERFWRTLRQGVLDHLGAVASLSDIRDRIEAFLDMHYHAAPHAGLMGKAPAIVYGPERREIDELSESRLREAFTVRERRRVHRDTTVSLRGQLFELEHGYLAGRMVDIACCLLDEPLAPVVEIEGRRIALRPVNPLHNGHMKRPPRRPVAEAPSAPVDFDPAGALLEKARRAGAQPDDLAAPVASEDDDGEEDLDAIF